MVGCSSYVFQELSFHCIIVILINMLFVTFCGYFFSSTLFVNVHTFCLNLYNMYKFFLSSFFAAHLSFFLSFFSFCLSVVLCVCLSVRPPVSKSVYLSFVLCPSLCIISSDLVFPLSVSSVIFSSGVLSFQSVFLLYHVYLGGGEGT